MKQVTWDRCWLPSGLQLIINLRVNHSVEMVFRAINSLSPLVILDLTVTTGPLECIQIGVVLLFTAAISNKLASVIV